MRFPSLAVLRTQSDDRLVALARAGNEQAFEAIVERYRRPLLRHAHKLVAETGAEDAVQQAFLSAWTALRRGDDVRELSAWLHRILHNVALNALRGAKRGEFAELTETVSAGVVPEDEIERRMAMRRTLAGVAALPERQREAVLRVAVQGRSQAEVARALGLSHGAVGQLVLRGRRALRAAGTALTPSWLVEWLWTLGSGGQPTAARIAEIAGGAGTGGAALTLGKVAAVVAVAGTATTGPALVQHHSDRARLLAEAPAAHHRAAPEKQHHGAGPAGDFRIEPAGHGGGASTAKPRPRGRASGPGSGGSRSSGSRSSGSDSSGSGSGSSGSGSGGPLSSGSGSGGSGPTASGSSGSGSSGSGSSGSGSSRSGSSGSGSSGSGSSGSSSSGSGSGGSGSGGSGSSGSGSSGSGESESGSSGSGASGSSSSGSGSSGSGSSGSVPTDSSSAGSVPSDSSGSGSSGSGSGDDSG